MNSTETESPSFVSTRDLLATCPSLRPAVIDRLLREGETMNVIAPPKTGKSWLVLDLAIAVATGRAWLDRFATVAGDVLIIDNELHGETLANRIPKVAQSRGVPIDEFADRLFVCSLRGGLQDIVSLGPRLRAIEPGRFRLVVLDAFYRFMPAGMDENANVDMATLYNHIDRYAADLRCSFVLIHHATKGNQSAKAVTDVGAGAGSQSRATDTHLVMRQHEEEGVVVLDAAVRSWPPVDPVCLRWAFPTWHVDDDLDPTQLRSDRPKRRAAASGQGWTAERFASEYMSEPATRDTIAARAQAAGMSMREAKRLISQAVADGLAEQESFNGRHAPRLWAKAARGDSCAQ